MPRTYASRTRVFHWTFDCPAERIWAVMADTERFNEAAKLPKYAVTEIVKPDGSVDYFGRVKVGPLSVDWQELPTNWVKDSWFRHERRFSSGPLATLCASLKVYPQDDGGCRAEYVLTAAPRNIVGWLMLATTFFSSTKKQFDALAAQACRFATGASDTEFEMAPPKLETDAASFLLEAEQAIAASPHNHGLASRLVTYVKERPDVDVRRIRPMTLADTWGASTADVIEVCLQATRDKLLGISWDLLCPRCKGAKARATALDRLPERAHCTSCNIDYQRDYAKNVELSFFPSRRVRKFDDKEFCLFGPMTTPHIWAQITVPAGETRRVPCPALPSGALRLRTLEPGGEASASHDGEQFPDVVATPGGIAIRAATQPGFLTFVNTTARLLTFIIDEAGWPAGALTADRAFSLQAFRDLFDESILRPGDHLQIEHVTFMFLDFKGSTALFEAAGDVTAYHLVREFFAMAGAAVRRNEGAIVKTVGDAINAAFSCPRNALAAAIDIQDAFAAFNGASAKPAIVGKIGLHGGKSIAVTLNNRLDYYGTVVNQAARLADLSSGGDIVVSAALATEPSVAAVIAGLPSVQEHALMKGFDLPVAFVRIALTNGSTVHVAPCQSAFAEAAA